MPRQGRGLEKIVESLERLLAREGVLVESPKHLRDVITDEAYEFDVVITGSLSGHHQLTVAIEVRDRKTPVGVGDINAFHMKCMRCGVGKGLFVSSSGFAKTAVTHAGTLDIQCLSLGTEDDSSWFLQGRTLPRVHRYPTNLHVTLVGDSREDAEFPVKYETPNGLVSSSELEAMIWSRIADDLRSKGLQKLKFDVPMDQWVGRLANGEAISLEKAEISYEIEETLEELPWQTLAYRDNKTGNTITILSIVRDTSSETITLALPGEGDKVKLFTTMEGLHYFA